jgi:PAS domain S-box-containing protein
MKLMNEVIGNELRSLRNSLGLSQSAFADALEISTRHLQNLEYGQSELTLTNLKRIKDVFNYNPLKLLSPLSHHDSVLPIEQIEVPLQISNTEGLILYENEACCRLRGYSQQEICGKMYIWDFIINEREKQDLMDYLKYLIENKPTPRPWISKNKTKNGDFISVRVNWHYILDHEGKVEGFSSMIYLD